MVAIRSLIAVAGVAHHVAAIDVAHGDGLVDLLKLLERRHDDHTVTVTVTAPCSPAGGSITPTEVTSSVFTLWPDYPDTTASETTVSTGVMSTMTPVIPSVGVTTTPPTTMSTMTVTSHATTSMTRPDSVQPSTTSAATTTTQVPTGVGAANHLMANAGALALVAMAALV